MLLRLVPRNRFGFRIPVILLCYVVCCIGLSNIRAGIVLGTAIRITDEFSIREAQKLNTYFVELDVSIVSDALLC